MNKILNIFLIFALFLVVSCKKESSPSCSISVKSPQESQEFYENEDIQIEIIADGGDSNIAYIHLYIDNVGYSSASISPYSMVIKAGDVAAGTHTLKVVAKNNNGKSCEASVTITVKEAVIETESPNFVTFSDGKLPSGWETNGWYIDQMGGYGGYNDIYSLFSKTPGTTVTALKNCKSIMFYMRGYGIVNFYIDEKLQSEIKVQYTGGGGGEQGWKAYNFVFPEGVHSFIWEYVGRPDSILVHIGVNLDAIIFK